MTKFNRIIEYAFLGVWIQFDLDQRRVRFRRDSRTSSDCGWSEWLDIDKTVLRLNRQQMDDYKQREEYWWNHASSGETRRDSDSGDDSVSGEL